MKRLEITEAMRDALAAIGRAEAIYVPGYDSGSLIELPKLALADATLAAVRAQQARHATKAERLARLPKPSPAVVVDVSLRPKRRRA